MPSSSEPLRNKFISEFSDGTAKAEKMLIDSGWKIERGMICKPKERNESVVTWGDQIDALDYLINEWDYSL